MLFQWIELETLSLFLEAKYIKIDTYHIIVIEITMGRPTYSHLGDRSDLIIRFEAFIRSLPTLFLFLRFVYRSWIIFSTKILQYSRNWERNSTTGT